MTALETVALEDDAWQNKHGDFSDVPLADDFAFTGPVASFDTADGYRAMVAEAGAAVFLRRWRSEPEPSGPTSSPLGRSSRREDGVVDVLEILRRELEGTMGLCGIIDVTNVPANTVIRGAVPSLEG
jgi:hypothetical protein